jgi:crossover junction endodeoxyribonuclease RuvC
MLVTGIDQSLTSSGLWNYPSHDHRILATDKMVDSATRLVFIRQQVQTWVTTHTPVLVAIEDYAYVDGLSSRQAQLGELGGVLRVSFLDWGQKLLIVNPGQLKKFASGKGNAKKTDMMIDALKRCKMEIRNDNECDAFWLGRLTYFFLRPEMCETPYEKEVIATLRTKEARLLA